VNVGPVTFGVAVGGFSGLGSALTDPVAVGIIVGLVVGKPLGITTATWLVTRFTRAKIDAGFAWIDVFGLAVLAGIGFTVSLLIGELAFGIGSERDDIPDVYQQPSTAGPGAV
jgi:NhaA family Na+:H+ antiporter